MEIITSPPPTKQPNEPSNRPTNQPTNQPTYWLNHRATPSEERCAAEQHHTVLWLRWMHKIALAMAALMLALFATLFIAHTFWDVNIMWFACVLHDNGQHCSWLFTISKGCAQCGWRSPRLNKSVQIHKSARTKTHAATREICDIFFVTIFCNGQQSCWLSTAKRTLNTVRTRPAPHKKRTGFCAGSQKTSVKPPTENNTDLADLRIELLATEATRSTVPTTLK